MGSPFTANKKRERPIRKPGRTTNLEHQFVTLWRILGGPALEAEYRFHPTRRWKADFAHVDSRSLFEIEGGVFIQGRHNRGSGFVADCEKYLAATLAGWTVFRLTRPQLNADTVGQIIAWVGVEAQPPPVDATAANVARTRSPSDGSMTSQALLV